MKGEEGSEWKIGEKKIESSLTAAEINQVWSPTRQGCAVELWSQEYMKQIWGGKTASFNVFKSLYLAVCLEYSGHV